MTNTADMTRPQPTTREHWQSEGASDDIGSDPRVIAEWCYAREVLADMDLIAFDSLAADFAEVR